MAAMILFCAPARAQTEDAVLQELSAPSNKTVLNGVLVAQNGLGNEAYIRQVTSAGSSGVETLQTGMENRILLVQTGNYLEVNVFQDGSHNLYEGNIEGEDAFIMVEQTGSQNIVSQALLLNNAGVSVIQNGSENEVIHTGIISTSGLHIQQQGNAMKVIVQTY